MNDLLDDVDGRLIPANQQQSSGSRDVQVDERGKFKLLCEILIFCFCLLTPHFCLLEINFLILQYLQSHGLDESFK
jgi:hypothetical protein